MQGYVNLTFSWLAELGPLKRQDPREVVGRELDEPDIGDEVHAAVDWV